MAVNYLNHINLHKNELQNVSLQKVINDPTGWKGGIIYNTTDNLFKYHDNAGWRSIASRSYADDVAKNEVDALFDFAGNQRTTIKSDYLPSYVDDVLEYDNFASLPNPGESGKIYVTLNDNLTYRWSGTQYIEISKSLALGTTSSTAFRGDWGQKLTTFFKNWNNGNVADGEGIAKYAESDASKNVITTTYLNKITNTDQTVVAKVIFNNSVDIKKTLNVAGKSTLGELSATNTSINGTLGVTGKSTLGELSATNTSINGTLGVTGKSAFDNIAFFKSKYTEDNSTGKPIGSYEFGGIKIGIEDIVSDKFPQNSFIVWDETHHSLRIEGDIYATGQVSAGGIGESGSGGSGNVLSKWPYDPNNHNGWALGANLGEQLRKYIGYNYNTSHPDSEPSLNDRITHLEENGASEIKTIGTGNFVSDVSKTKNIITVTKGTALVSNNIKNITIANGAASSPGNINVLQGGTITIPSKISDLSNEGNLPYSRVFNKIITLNTNTNEITINHNLGTKNVIVSLYDKNMQQVFTNVIIVDNNNIKFTFGTITTAETGDYTAIIVG